MPPCQRARFFRKSLHCKGASCRGRLASRPLAFGALGLVGRGQRPSFARAVRPSAASARVRVGRGQARSALAKCFSQRTVFQGLCGLPVLRQSARGGVLRGRLVQRVGAQVRWRCLQGEGALAFRRWLCHRPRAGELALTHSVRAHSRS
jgi:hypothetical protein